MAAFAPAPSAQRTKRSRSVRQVIGYGLLYIFLAILGVIFLFPFYSMVVGSLMPKEEFFRSYPQLWPPNGPQLTAYRLLLQVATPEEVAASGLQNIQNYDFLRYIFNTLLIASVAVALQVFFNTLAGYTFAKRNFPFKNQLFSIILATLLLPAAINFVPFYLLVAGAFGWKDTYWPFWIPSLATAFGIFLMRQFIASTIPDELIDSATIDGASQFQIVTHIVMPIMAGGMVVLGILTFVSVYNEYVLTNLIISKPDLRTVQLFLANFKQATIRAPLYDLLFAGSVMATIPLLILFFVFQRKLVEGVMSGAIKG
ncbi:MAG: carbohydrate ABC transporter permease [Thermoflexales bacterium]|nr:carbohydrate ABC transporter permease [Thermoflexales bacterium]MDW8351119.1 carbohydrate ABC transporter permease [Anaerolineae bacterium]